MEKPEKIESMRKRYETAKKAVEQVNRMEDLHQSASIDLEDALVDLDELIAWAERALREVQDSLDDCCGTYDSVRCANCDRRAQLLAELDQGPRGV